MNMKEDERICKTRKKKKEGGRGKIMRAMLEEEKREVIGGSHMTLTLDFTFFRGGNYEADVHPYPRVCFTSAQYLHL